MKFHQERQPSRIIYRIDRTLPSGEHYEWYGSEIYDNRKAAEKAAAKRFSKYLEQITIVEIYEEAHDSLVSEPFEL